MSLLQTSSNAWFCFTDIETKKSLIAAGVVVVLGIVWTSNAWYTGKKLETYLAEAVAQASDQLRRLFPEAGIELSYQNYQRGVFNSQL